MDDLSEHFQTDFMNEKKNGVPNGGGGEILSLTGTKATTHKNLLITAKIK